MMKKIYTLIATILIVVSVFAQVPQKMSYQAIIRNSYNTLVTNQKVSMKISILQNQTPVYVEEQTTTSNENGLVTVQIGDGNIISGTFSDIKWGTGAFFIKTETDPDGGTYYSIVGTSELLSVPYALYSTASGSSGANIDDTVVSSNSTWSSFKISSLLGVSGNPLSLATVATTGMFSDLLGKPTTLAGYGITDGGTGSLVTMSGDATMTPAGVVTISNDAITTSKIKDGTIGDADLNKSNISLSGFGTPYSNISMDGYKITNLATPTSSKDAVTKSYVDDLIASGSGSSTFVPIMSLDNNMNLSLRGGNLVSLADLYQSLSLAGTVISISGPRDSHVDLASLLATSGGSSSSGNVLHDATLTGSGSSSNVLGIANQGITPIKLSGIYSNGNFGQVLSSTGNGNFIWADAATGSGTGGGLSSVIVQPNNGITASVSNVLPTSTITLGLGAITPSSISTSGNITTNGSITGFDITGTTLNGALNASNLTGTLRTGLFGANTIPITALIGNGNSATYLKGDGTWGTPAVLSSFASAINTTAITGVIGTNVQTSLESLKSLIDGNSYDIASKITANVAIIGSTKTKITYDLKGLVLAGSDATAGDIKVTPTGTITSTNVQTALEELQAKIITAASGGMTSVFHDGTLTGNGNNTALGLPLLGTAGTYKSVTTDSQGRVISGTNPTTIAGYGITDAKIDNLSDVSVTSKLNNDALIWNGLKWVNKPVTTMIPLANSIDPGLLSATDKNKLDGLSTYILPLSSATSLGGVKVGSTLSIDGSGVLNITGTVGDITGVIAGPGLTGGGLTGDATIGFAPIANNTLLGNNTGASSVPAELNALQVKTLLSLDNVKNVDQTNASNLTSGTIPVARYGTSTIPVSAMSLTGTPSLATYLSGNGTWELLAASSISGILPVVNGGTGIGSFTTGNYINAGNATTLQQRTPAQVKIDLGLDKVENTADADKVISNLTNTALLLKENLANKSTNVTVDATSDIKYPSVNAIKTYVDSRVDAAVLAAGGVPTASPTRVGTIQMVGDLGGTGTSPTVPGLLLKEPLITNLPATKGGTGIISYTAGNFITAATSTTLQQLTPTQVKANLGLDLVSNTSDLGKPVSTLTQNALDLKIDKSEKAANNGVATLDATGKIPSNQIPAVSFSSVDVLALASDMTSLTSAVVGSIAIITGNGKNYVLAQTPASVMANWKELNSAPSPVQSVNTYIGNVTLTKSDIALPNVDNTTDLLKPLSTAAITALSLKEDLTNKSNDGTLSGASTTKYTTVNAVKTYVDSKVPVYTSANGSNVLTVNAAGTATAWQPAAAGSGTVTGVQVIGNSGISATVSNANTSPLITLGLGIIAPTSINMSGNITTTGNISTGNITASGTLSAPNFSGTATGVNTGDQTISLSGVVSGSGTGSIVTTIAANKIAYSMLPVMTTNKLLGSGASGTGVSEITLGTGLSFTGSTLNATGGGTGTVTTVTGSVANGVTTSIVNPTTTPAITVALGAITPTSVAATGTINGTNVTGTAVNTGDQTITLTGDVTGSGTGSFAASIGTGKVTTTQILDGTVTATDIANQTITATKLSNISSNGTAGQVLTTNTTGGFTWTSPSGTGDMNKATYDPGNISEQLVGLIATQTLTNKTLTSPVINTPIGILKGDVGLGSVDNTADASKNVASAATATKLTTARTINGIAFDGTANITITAAVTDPNLTALSGLSTTGLIARTATGVATRTISGGTGINVTNGDGVSNNPTIALASTPVIAGDYTSANISVDAQGRITAAANGSGGGGGAATNLGYTASTTQGLVTSSTGTGTPIPAATIGSAGLLLPADFSKLTNISGYTSSDVNKVLTVNGSGTASWVLPPSGTILGYTASATDGKINNTSTGTFATIPVVTGTNAGLMIPGDYTKLVKFADIASGTTDQNKVLTVNASGIATWVLPASGVTNLTFTPSATTGSVTSSTGTAATISTATTTNSGLLLPADFTKLSKMPTITNTPTANTVLFATSTTSATWQASSAGIANLAFTPAPTYGTVTSSTGTAATIATATTTNAGLLLPADFSKLVNIPGITNSPSATNTILTATSATSATWTAPAAGGVTNITYTAAAAKGTVNSSTGTGVDLPPATGTTAGLLLPADFSKLSYIPNITNLPSVTNTVLTATSATSATWTAPSAGGATNLTYTAAATKGTVTPSTGTGVDLPSATTTNAGLLLPAEKVILNTISTTTVADAAKVLTVNAAGTAATWVAPAAGGGGGSTYQTYQPSGNANMFVRATGPGVTSTLAGNTVTITIPDGVTLNYYRIKSTFAAVGNTALNFVVIDQSTSTTDITNTSADNLMLPFMTLYDIGSISPIVEVINNMGQMALLYTLTGVTNRTINFYITGLSSHNASNGFYINLKF